MSVDSFGFSNNLLQAIKAIGYSQLTPVQQRAIPVIRAGHDVLASAQTGTGKTAAFLLPIIEKLEKEDKGHHELKAVVLTPTRELAIQVAQESEKFCQHLSLKTAVVYGGAGMGKQASLLKEGVDILVATPGRLLEHLQLRNLSLSSVRTLVLDEADRMLDMGFLTDIEQIIPQLKAKHQTLMFSATFSNKVKSLASEILHHAKQVEVAKQNSTSGKVEQSVYWVSEARKRELLSELIGVNNWQQVMVFAGTRESANILAKELKLDGIKAALCHGDKSQGARNKALEQFVSGQVRVLVATDVAARGLDIPDLPYVINFHLPFLAEDYVHRIGRTGRAGKSGHAISLVSPKDEKFLGNIETLIGRKFNRIIVPGYEFDAVADKKATDENNTKSSKNRYQATKDKNFALEKKRKEKSQLKVVKGKAKKGLKKQGKKAKRK